MMNRTYTELSKLKTFTERYEYLRLGALVGKSTFGFDRYLNQAFYRSKEWTTIRNFVISRDGGYDLGLPDYEISTVVLVHHMNPVKVDDIERRAIEILDPEFLITVSHRTHQAIHYGDEKLLAKPMVVRRPGDTKLW